jgi:hypothetical protein
LSITDAIREDHHMSESTDIELLHRVWEAMSGAGDLSVLEGALDPEAQWLGVEDGQICENRKMILAIMKRNPPDLKLWDPGKEAAKPFYFELLGETEPLLDAALRSSRRQRQAAALRPRHASLSMSTGGRSVTRAGLHALVARG